VFVAAGLQKTKSLLTVRAITAGALETMKVLVTGGTGFIGSTLVRHLLAAKYEVRVLARQRKDSFLLENLPLEVVNGDVTNLRAVEKAVEGCSVVFNLASLYAFYPFWVKEPKAIYKINVIGTVHMLEASLKYGVKRFIHTSTIATLNARSGPGPADESTGFESRGASHYARSKYLAEQEVMKFCQKGLPAVILNPAIVIGERDHKPTPSGDVIVKFLNKKYPGYFDSLWSVADADDVARAHLAAMEGGRAGERYILANSKHATLKEIFQLLEKITGIKAPRLRIPYGLLFAVTYLDEMFSHFLFRKKPLMPTEGVKFCKMSAKYNNSKAVLELGYTPTPFEKTLEKAAAWYRKNAYVEPHGILRTKARGLRVVRWFMQRLRMEKFTDKLNLGTIFFFGIVKMFEFLRKAGVSRNIDGWRKVTQCYLRTEQSKFSLSVFGLNLWSDVGGEHERTFDAARQHCVQRLARFLKAYPVFHSRLEWGPFCAKSRPQDTLDIVEAVFDEKGGLCRLDPRLDQEAGGEKFKAMPEEVRELLLRGIVQVYNGTKDRPDKKRSLILKKEWDRWLLKRSGDIPGPWRKPAAEYGERILSAVFIRFEILPAGFSGTGSGRFKVPAFIKSKHPGYGVLNITGHLTPDFQETDLWFQLSHIPMDGVPDQEILNDLKKEWGTRGELLFPASGYPKDMTPEICSAACVSEDIFQAYQFLDFQPFLKVRNELNRRFGRRAKQVVSSAALLIWKLAQYKEFEDIKFAVPVDLRATSGRARTLGFVFIRPNVYFDRYRPDRGFFEFQQEFNRQLFATRKRHSESYRLLEAYAVAAPFLYAATTKFLPGPLHNFVGTLGITIIKKADFFMAPASDVHTDGFIAFSNFSLPAEDGGQVCAVSMKGPREKVQKYMHVLQDVMHRAIQYDELYF
jgi:dihydroflavonol-4-reductase